MKYSAIVALVSLTSSVLLVLPANAQATRTWVSGVGDDINTCARTEPCKTFAGAISKTAAGGEINCLDSGGFGAVTIVKSITIDCEDVSNGGVLASFTDGIKITTGTVTLRGLDINGAGTGLFGVNVLGAATVTVQKSRIYGFTNAGIRFAFGGTLVVANTTINNGNVGVVLDGAGGAARMTFRDVVISGNSGNGVSVQSSGAAVNALIDRTTIASNGGTGLAVSGASTVLLGGSTITGNGTGLSNSGSNLYSFKNNQIGGNGVDGTPIAAFPGPGGALQ
jgi:hypothetical protein